MTAPAFWVTAPGHGEVRPTEVGAPGADDVVVEARVSAVSRGTESLVFTGRVPKSQYETMRCPFQEGGFPGPLKYGYASVGVVVETGVNATTWQGRRVFSLYPHQQRYVVPAAAVHGIADDVPDDRAALAANMETALNAMWDAGPRIGDRIAVVGGGVVGCLVAALAAAMPATKVQLIDIDAGRADVAAALGVGFALPDQAVGDADVVFHASGHGDGLATALGLAGFEATVVELSWYGDGQVAVPLGEAFHVRRLRLMASQVGHVAAARRARRTRAERLAQGLELLRDGRFDALITGRCRLQDLPEGMARLAAAPAGALCQLVTY